MVPPQRSLNALSIDSLQIGLQRLSQAQQGGTSMAHCVFMHKADSIYDDIPAGRDQVPAQYIGRAEPCIGDSRRRILLSCVVGVSMLAACSNQPSREDLQNQVDELQDQVDDLQAQLDKAHSEASDAVDAATEAKNAADEAQSQTQRFSSEDWQEVVPDVQSAAGNAVDAADKAADAAQDVEDATSEQ